MRQKQVSIALKVNTVEMMRCDHCSTVVRSLHGVCFFYGVVLTRAPASSVCLFGSVSLTSHTSTIE